ncbi:porin family protein [Maribellus maritimus]|uniref:porin family protein n=1 Tax=Maribellus maritimus TaxID=2870838 RepID=UPI001EECAFA8|nr:porin family protein [Maribellus maritimus]MCG6188339.1 PorT family protein [Maribellus maritimus]
MKKIVIITLSIILISGTALYAQESQSGIKGGLNLSSLTTDGNNDKNLKTGFHAGVYTKIPLSESFAIQPELMYSGKGIKLNYDESAFADGETKFNLNYIDLPVKLVFNLSEDFEFQFGPYVGYLINANVDTNAEVLDFWNIESNDELNREHFHSLDYGLTAGLGFDLEPLILGFNYNLGLNQVAKDDDASYDILGDAKNSVIQVYVGMKF